MTKRYYPIAHGLMTEVKNGEWVHWDDFEGLRDAFNATFETNVERAKRIEQLELQCAQLTAALNEARKTNRGGQP